MSTNESSYGKLIIEWAPFKLAEGVDQTALIVAADDLQTGFFAWQSGFIRRELLHAGGRQYAEIIYWHSRADAEAAGKLVMQSPIAQAYFQLIDPPDDADPSGGFLHLEQVKVFSK
jgi:hypothetical protein